MPMRLMFVLVILAACRLSLAQDKIWVPVVDGDWWKIADDDPDVSPHKIVRDHNTNACDFTIFRDAGGLWHLVACIRQTDAPGERLFHRWESPSLDKRDWTPKGLFPVARGMRGSPLAITSVQAPHAFTFGGRYYMFYNSAAARCMISDDGRAWQQHKDHAGNLDFFAMGRDVCIFRDEPGSRWIAYYTGKPSDPAIRGDTMAARTAGKLEGPWSANVAAVRREGNPESPFVLRHRGRYYLWQQMTVYVSDDPMNFNGSEIAHMTGIWYGGKYAPEVIEHEGQHYLAGYSRGIWLAKLKWMEKSADEITAWRKEWREYLERERQLREAREALRAPGNAK